MTVRDAAGTPASDRAAKRQRLLGILEGAGLGGPGLEGASPGGPVADALVLSSHAAVSWYLDGARTHASLAGDPLLAVIVDRDGDTVVTSSNERARLVDEELPPGVAVVAVPWHEPLSTALPGGPLVLHEHDVAPELRAARAPLLPLELARYRALGRDCAEVLTGVLGAARPADRETDVAAAVAAALVARGIDPLVILVAGRPRLGHRHPLPTGGPLEDRAMVVVCGRRHGMIANLTRWVRFGPARDGERDAERRIRDVEAAFFAATVAGTGIADVFAAGSSAYAANGFDPDEWRNHHQGGAAGYNGRDPRATPAVPDLVHVGQAFAWNPTAPGAKIEDTVLVTADGIDVLTADEAWPTVTVGGVRRPVELQN